MIECSALQLRQEWCLVYTLPVGQPLTGTTIFPRVPLAGLTAAPPTVSAGARNALFYSFACT